MSVKIVDNSNFLKKPLDNSRASANHIAFAKEITEVFYLL